MKKKGRIISRVCEFLSGAGKSFVFVDGKVCTSVSMQSCDRDVLVCFETCGGDVLIVQAFGGQMIPMPARNAMNAWVVAKNSRLPFGKYVIDDEGGLSFMFSMLLTKLPSRSELARMFVAAVKVFFDNYDECSSLLGSSCGRGVSFNSSTGDFEEDEEQETD